MKNKNKRLLAYKKSPKYKITMSGGGNGVLTITNPMLIELLKAMNQVNAPTDYSEYTFDARINK